MGVVDDRIQSCVQIKLSTTLGDRELLNGSSTQPPVLKVDSDATVETGIANTSCTIEDRIRNR